MTMRKSINNVLTIKEFRDELRSIYEREETLNLLSKFSPSLSK